MGVWAPSLCDHVASEVMAAKRGRVSSSAGSSLPTMSLDFDLVTTDHRGAIGGGRPFNDLATVSGDRAGPFITEITVFH